MTGRVLFVDDEPRLLEGIRWVLGIAELFRARVPK